MRGYMPTFKLRDLVDLEEPEQPTSDFAYPGDRWVTVGTFWAQIIPMSAATRAVANQVVADVTHQIIIRNPYRGKNRVTRNKVGGAGIRFQPTPLQRVRDENNTLYAIKTVTDIDGDGAYFELMATVEA